jgi:hypothetical protein
MALLNRKHLSNDLIQGRARPYMSMYHNELVVSANALTGHFHFCTIRRYIQCSRTQFHLTLLPGTSKHSYV